MRRIGRRKIKRKTSWLLHLSAIAAAVLVFFMVLDARIRPVLTSMARYQCQALAVAVMNDAVADALAEEENLYDQLVEIVRDDTGRVTALKMDNAAENRIRTKLTEAITARLAGLQETTEIRIPLGTLLNWQLMAGRGPNVTMRMQPSGFVESKTTCTFESTGINQSQHSIYIEFSTDMSAVMPGYSAGAVVTTQICIARMLIVGEVPQFYAAAQT